MRFVLNFPIMCSLLSNSDYFQDPELGTQIKAALESGKGDVIVVVTKAMESECITSFKTADA